MTNYESELNCMEQSVQNLPCWFLIAISNIIDSEMNARDATTRGVTTPLTDSLTAKGDEGIVGSGAAKVHLMIVKGNGEMK
jgi:hypothetical protein